MIYARSPLAFGVTVMAASALAEAAWTQTAETPAPEPRPEVMPQSAPTVRPRLKPSRQADPQVAPDVVQDTGNNMDPAATSDADTGFALDLERPAHRALERVRADYDLAPFTTDGCSGGMSATWRVIAQSFPGFDELHGDLPPWEDCCIIHDKAYHDAGPDPTPEASFAARLAADEALRQCVVDTAHNRATDLAQSYEVSEAFVIEGFTAIGDAMFTAVRAGGVPCSGLPWRWGYGYPLCLAGPQDFLGWE